MPSDRDREERQARIVQMMAKFRDAKRREAVRRGMRLWRKAESRQRIVDLEAKPERIH